VQPLQRERQIHVGDGELVEDEAAPAPQHAHDASTSSRLATASAPSGGGDSG
jgi:hypothetical protein